MAALQPFPVAMSRPYRAFLFVLQFATLGLAVAFVVTRLYPERFAQAAPNAAATAAPSAAGAVGPVSYAEGVARAAPSVVNIYTRRLVTDQPYAIFGDPTYQRFQGTILVPPRRRLTPSLGSGVIVRSDGYVLTNNHVITDAQGILVGFSNGNTVPATVVGSDRETDLAVLKIDAQNLPAAEVAQDALAVGDVVLAIGNPGGVGQSVTMGIVSATGRNQMNLSRFEDFIQTDAAINFGNSGGALVNARGELVGINTALFRAGLGISFAIPAPAAQRVMQQIIEHGYVIRGWIGAEYSDTPIEARGDPATARGVQVQLVLPGGPADVAGLQPRDVLLTFNGQSINDEVELRSLESSLAPGSQATITGMRAGVPFSVELTLTQRGEAPQSG